MAVQRAKATSFGVGDGASPEVFTAIANLLECTFSGLAWDTEETTPHSATLRKEFLPTLADEGDIQVMLLYDPSSTPHAALKTLANGTNATANYQLTLPGSIELRTVAAFITSWVWGNPKGEYVKATINFKVTGAATIA